MSRVLWASLTLLITLAMTTNTALAMSTRVVLNVDGMT